MEASCPVSDVKNSNRRRPKSRNKQRSAAAGLNDLLRDRDVANLGAFDCLAGFFRVYVEFHYLQIPAQLVWWKLSENW